jgi:hypothetical protein
MTKKLILAVVTGFMLLIIAFGLYIFQLKKQTKILLEEKFYYFNNSIRSDNDVRALGYILVSTGIHLEMVDSILLQHSEVSSYVEISGNDSETIDRELMTLKLVFSPDSMLNQVHYFQRLPMD